MADITDIKTILYTEKSLNLQEQNAFDYSYNPATSGIYDNDVMATGQRNLLS